MSSDIQTSSSISSLVMGKAGDPVPVSNYKAKFLRCDEDEGNPEYPPAYRWTWEIVDGEFTGRLISCLTSQKVNSMSNAGKLIAMLNGGPVEADSPVDLKSFVGVAYLCSVVKCGKNNGGTKVDTVFRI